jgi:nicotinamidase/pyrazinamidase
MGKGKMKTVKIPQKDWVASFDVHAQKTFTPLCPHELPAPEGDQIVAELNRQAKKARFRIGSKEAHNPQAIWVADEDHPVLSLIKGENVDVRWPVHSVPGTLGFELLDGLPKVTDYDYFIWEGIELDLHPYGACYHDHAERLSTGVIEFLRHHRISTIIIGGLATDFCVKTTALQLLRAQFQVVINLAACRGLYPASIEEALILMQSKGAIIAENAEAIENC